MKYSTSSRPYRSMISPKYRQREERRKMLKISAGKLSRIDDPEASLCRSVLINNTLRRLRKEPAPSPPAPEPDFAIDVPVDDQEDMDTSMFCVPPTPRLLTSIDDDDVDVPSGKRPRIDHQEYASCGQASMLDGAVFHSLIASLETT